MVATNHYNKKRRKRERFINRYIGGDGNIIDSFIVDKGHKNGEEIHYITDNGIIVICNKESGKLITKKIARPNQIKKLYNGAGREPPNWLMYLAQYHHSLNYNCI